MSLPKIRLEDADRVAPDLWRPDDATLRHLTKALRLYEGAAVEGLFAAEGKKFFMKLVRRDGEFFLQTMDEEDDLPGDLRIVLLVGLLKQDQFEAVLRVCAELGVDEIAPLACERSVPRFGSLEMPKKMSRWNKILAEATKVSGSVHPPTLHTPCNFAAFDWSALPEPRYAAILSPDAVPISSAAIREGELAIAVGPEGDWSASESAALLQKNFKPVSLGRRILRASTAVTAAIAYLRMRSPAAPAKTAQRP